MHLKGHRGIPVLQADREPSGRRILDTGSYLPDGSVRRELAGAVRPLLRAQLE